MTKEAALKYKPEIAALQEGKTIQRRFKETLGGWSPWVDDSDPYFAVDPTVELRVKPSPEEWWMVIRELGDPRLFSSQSAAGAFTVTNPLCRRIVHVKEVL